MTPTSIPLKYLSAGFGALVWLAGCLISGRAEAWDSGLYWVLFFPLLLCGAPKVLAQRGYRKRRAAA